MNNNNKYLKKYLKYKEKYLNLLKTTKMLKGGALKYINNEFFGCADDMDPLKIIQLTNNNIVVCYTSCYKIFDINSELIKKVGDSNNFKDLSDQISLLNFIKYLKIYHLL